MRTETYTVTKEYFSYEELSEKAKVTVRYSAGRTVTG